MNNLLESIDQAVSLKEPAECNRAITECHYQLSQALRRITGPDAGANFHSWAVWGSKKAGVTIRQEDLDQAKDDAMAALTAVTGIGRWTAEVYLLFALDRADIFPSGDLALQVAVQDLKRLPERPGEKQLREIAQAWHPNRGVAARLLWRYYGVVRKRADPVSVA